MRIQYISDSYGKYTGVFIPIDKWEILKKRLDYVNFEYIEPTKEVILQGLKNAFEEVELLKQGEKQPNSFKDLINELQNNTY